MMSRLLKEAFRETLPPEGYDPQAVIDCEDRLRLIADAHPEYRVTVDEAVSHLTRMWCRLAHVRNAVR